MKIGEVLEKLLGVDRIKKAGAAALEKMSEAAEKRTSSRDELENELSNIDKKYEE